MALIYQEVIRQANMLAFNDSFWLNSTNYNIANNRAVDRYTGGLVGSIALPLLGIAVETQSAAGVVSAGTRDSAAPALEPRL